MGFVEKGVSEVLGELKSSEVGLRSSEAQKRLLTYGRNELEKKGGTSPFVLFINQFKSFIILILFVATIISAWHHEWIDAIVILIILVLNAVMGFVQEFKAEKSLEALQKMASLKAVVLRDGKEVSVDAAELVPGDVIILETGEKIPADARIIEAVNLQCQEGALTGESVAVSKQTSALKAGLPLGDRKNMIFSGTIITQGRGKAVVTGTGMKSEIGKIADMLEQSEREQTPLQKKLGHLGKVLGIITIIVSVVVFLVGILRGGELIEMFGAAVALAVAAIPEGLPAVITIALGIGVQKMVRKNALVRKLPSVETLGAVTVICSDKTGTLTHNQMTVVEIYSLNGKAKVSGSGYEPNGKITGKFEPLLLKIGALCNDAELTEEKKGWGVIGDPTEGCLITSAMKGGFDAQDLRKQYKRIDELGFDSSRKMMTTFYKVKGKVLSYTKGAPDNILAHCDRVLVGEKVRKITAADKKKILLQNKKFSEGALRVLGFAYNDGKKGKEAETNMIFVGLQAMIDPPREEVKGAIAKCSTAGIRVIMITGDHMITAAAIAEELGIKGRAVEGKDIASMNLAKELDSIGVFARVNPEHKLAIVEALKKQGHVVAMTGDGVNDAPALKKADIGVAMGITGTDVAKEASTMILTDDNFTSIVGAVEEGRNIYDNIKKFVNYLLSSNMGEVLILFFAMLIGFSIEGNPVLPLAAIQILWLNLITDGLPALALGVDPADPQIMKRKPRNPKENIITKNMAWNIGIIGIMLTIGVLLVFAQNLHFGIAKAQTMALTLLVVLEIVRLEMIRGQYHTPFFSNKWLMLALSGVLVLQLAIIYVPALAGLFGLVPLGLFDWVEILLIGAATFVVGKVVSKLIIHYTHQSD